MDVAFVMFAKDLFVQTVVARCLAEIFVLVLVADNMKNTKKITLCGLIAALSSAIMLTSFFPYLTYAIPAISGLFVMIPLIECGVLWSVGTYIVSSVIILFTGELEATILYIMFMGYYPILKYIVERINKCVIEWVLKILGFNIVAIAYYYVLTIPFGRTFDDFGDFGKYSALIFLLICNIVFVLYDIGISRVASSYMMVLHDKVKKIIK